MEKQTNLTAKEILNKKFQKDVKGYNAKEVDEFLDLVISDYQLFVDDLQKKETEIVTLRNQLHSIQNGNNACEADLNELREKVKGLEIENASYKNRLEGIRPSDRVSQENMELVKKVNRYEQFFWKKGISKDDVEKELSGSGDGYAQ